MTPVGPSVDAYKSFEIEYNRIFFTPQHLRLHSIAESIPNTHIFIRVFFLFNINKRLSFRSSALTPNGISTNRLCRTRELAAPSPTTTD